MYKNEVQIAIHHNKPYDKLYNLRLIFKARLEYNSIFYI